MKNALALKLLLILSGLVAVGFGAALTFAPVALEASIGLDLGDSASLLSEIRAPGGGLLAAGFLILSGAFLPRMAFTATVMSMTLYLGYGLARMFSIIIDGMPASTLAQVAILEIALGLVSAAALSRYKQTS